MIREEAIEVLDDMKVKIDIPKSAVTQHKRNEALDMAISALSAEGEYIKKSDILNELGDTNMDILTDEVKEIVNGLPSYSFPDSAENKGEWKKIWRDDCECSEYVCSKCGCGEDYVSDFCPNCGADMRGEADERS